MSLLLFLGLIGCAQECPPCEDCSASEPQGVTLEPWQEKILAPTLKELTDGVQLHGEEGIGICEGTRECDKFLGLEVQELAEGTYFIHSMLDVPAVGDPWTVSFKMNCVTTNKEGVESNRPDYEKTYTVRHAGKEKGFRLSPIWKIQSPHPSGARDCKFSLTPIRPDGVAAPPWSGTYKTPLAAE